jgi:hypothetical protein
MSYVQGVGTWEAYPVRNQGNKIWGKFWTVLNHPVQNGSGPYPMGTRGYFPGGKAAGA